MPTSSIRVASTGVCLLLLFLSLPAQSSEFKQPHLILEWSSYGATAFAMGPRGTSFVATFAGTIAKYSQDGDFLTDWKSHDPAGFRSLTGLTVSGSGLVYSCEYYGNRVQVFDSSGRFIRMWGEHGKGRGQIDRPTAIAVDGVGNVYVVEEGNHRVQKFTDRGRYLASWGGPAGSAAYLELPTAITVGSDGRIFVTDFSAGGVRVFSKEGHFLGRWGPGPGAVPPIRAVTTTRDKHGVTASMGLTPELTPELARTLCDSTTHQASGVAVDPSGNVFVFNGVCQRVQKYAPKGLFLGGWWIDTVPAYVGGGEADLALASTGEIYVAQMNGHVRVFGYGPSRYESALSKRVGLGFVADLNRFLTVPWTISPVDQSAGHFEDVSGYVGFDAQPVRQAIRWEIPLPHATRSDFKQVDWALRGVLKSRGFSTQVPPESLRFGITTSFEGRGGMLRATWRAGQVAPRLVLERRPPALDSIGTTAETCDLRVLEGNPTGDPGIWGLLIPSLRTRWPRLEQLMSSGTVATPEMLEAVREAHRAGVSESDRDLVLLTADTWLRSRGGTARDELGPEWNRYEFASARAEGDAFIYCGSVLKRLAKRAGGEDPWADRALLVLLDLGWSTDCTDTYEGAVFANEIYVPVVKHGEEFLRAYPHARVWASVALRTALAHETAWSLGMETPPDDFPDYRKGMKEHRQRALELYRQLLPRTHDPRMERAIRKKIRALERNQDTKCHAYYITGEC